MVTSSSLINRRYQLLLIHIATHASIIPMIIFGEMRHYFVALGVYFLTGCLGMTMTFHRLLSHGSWNSPEWFEKLGTLFGTIGLTGSSVAWVATHREHHMFSDQSKDPHSPHFQSWLRVQFLSMLRKPNIRYAKDLIQQPFHKWLHRNYLMVNVGFMICIGLVDPFAVIYAYLFPAMILWNAGSSINTIGHLFGYKSFETRDQSRNNILLGIFVWGEGWHNNHHRYLKSPYFGNRWFELDIAGLLIRILKRQKIVEEQ